MDNQDLEELVGQVEIGNSMPKHIDESLGVRFSDFKPYMTDAFFSFVGLMPSYIFFKQFSREDHMDIFFFGSLGITLLTTYIPIYGNKFFDGKRLSFLIGSTVGWYFAKFVDYYINF